MSVYHVNKISANQLKITGMADDELWLKATKINQLQSPWNSEFRDETTFKALWDKDFFYFSFIVPEYSVYRDLKDNSDESIGNSDRVELFFRIDETLTPYYCLEMDPTPRLMDFKALPNKNFDLTWCWPKQEIDIKSKLCESHYVVEGAISIKTLKNLDLLKNNKLQIGVYRAKFIKQSNGIYEPTWLTWVDSKTKEPNFHIASSFGEFCLLEN